MRRVYLDHAATTPMLAPARAAMAEACARWANPSSPHAEGRAARAALEEARARIKAALGWPHALVFTSGASEAAGIALRGAVDTRMSAVEHDAIRRAAPEAAVLAVSQGGLVELDTIDSRPSPAFAGEGGDPSHGDGEDEGLLRRSRKKALARPSPAKAGEGFLVAVQSVNSETGVIQPAHTGERIRARGGAWLADCAQSAGKLPLPDADIVIVSAHKLGGPPGVGALLARDLALLRPTGGQEQGYRGGTENLPAILGFAAALEARGSRAHLPGLRARLDAAVRDAGGEVVADAGPRLPEIASYRLPGMAAAAQLIRLDLAGIAVSAGSACSSGALRPSAVLTAMGWSETAAREVIRVSFAPETGAADADAFLAAWLPLADEARRRTA